jgi:hypothetical protein
VLWPLRQILIILDPFQSFGNSFDAIRWHSYDSPFSYVSSRPRQFFRYCLCILSVVCSSLCSVVPCLSSRFVQEKLRHCCMRCHSVSFDRLARRSFIAAARERNGQQEIKKRARET